MTHMNDTKIVKYVWTSQPPTSLLLVRNNSSDKIFNIDMALVYLQWYMINMYINIYTRTKSRSLKNNHVTMAMNGIEQK